MSTPNLQSLWATSCPTIRPSPGVAARVPLCLEDVGSPDPATQHHFLRLVGLLRLVTVDVPGTPPPPSIPAGRRHVKTPAPGVVDGASYQQGQEGGPKRRLCQRSLWRAPPATTIGQSF